MIDIEPRVYTTIRSALKEEFPNINITGKYTDSPAKFPHVSIEETNNAVDASYSSTSDREYAANVTYTVNIYTNTETAKADAKNIAKIVNDTFSVLGFARSLSQPLPNIDRTIYRYTMRFTALVSKAYDGEEGHYNTTL